MTVWERNTYTEYRIRLDGTLQERQEDFSYMRSISRNEKSLEYEVGVKV